jgi:hypothetical protein
LAVVFLRSAKRVGVCQEGNSSWSDGVSGGRKLGRDYLLRCAKRWERFKCVWSDDTRLDREWLPPARYKKKKLCEVRRIEVHHHQLVSSRAGDAPRKQRILLLASQFATARTSRVKLADLQKIPHNGLQIPHAVIERTSHPLLQRTSVSNSMSPSLSWTESKVPWAKTSFLDKGRAVGTALIGFAVRVIVGIMQACKRRRSI